MKNSAIKKIIKTTLTIVQILMIIAPITLQYFSDKKMGVKRYVIFKQAVFSKEIFTTNVMFLLKFTLIALTSVAIAFIVYYSLKKITNFLVKPLLKLILLDIVTIFYLFSNQFKESIIYHFFLIAAFVIIVLQHIKVILDYEK